MLSRSTLVRAMVTVSLFAVPAWAVDLDFRAGPWQGTIERGAGIERIVLLLTVFVKPTDGTLAETTALARFESDTGVCQSNKPVIESYRVSFDCIAINSSGKDASAGGRFEGNFSPGSDFVTGTWRGEPVKLTRPKQTALGGDWVAENDGVTCVVRFFEKDRLTLAENDRSILMNNGRGATIDIYSKESGVFGRQIVVTNGSGRVTFGWEDTDKNMFLGKLGADNAELTGNWYGNDFACGQPDHKATFHWTRSSL